MERKVDVWGRICDVHLDHDVTNRWRATGTYMGETIVVESRSASSALSLWKSTATYRGNDR